MSESLSLIQIVQAVLKKGVTTLSSPDGRRLRITCAVLVSLLIFSAANAFATTDCTFITQGKTMRLKADCTTDATIKIPQDFTLDGAGHTITGHDPSGDHWRGAVVSNAGTRANVFNLSVTVSGLQDMCDIAPTGTSGIDRLRGIAFYNVSGFIAHNRILGINQGHGSVCQEGTGILVETTPYFPTQPNTQQVTVLDNEIVDAQTFGIAVQGDVVAYVSGNRIGLSDEIGDGLAQNGIAFSYGAKGTALLNKIQGGFTNGKLFFTNGVNIFEASNVTAASNWISGVQEGIFLQSDCFRGPMANNNRIQANLITGAFEGIVLVARSYDFSTCNAHVDGNNISFNIIKSGAETTPQTGIFYGVQVFGGSFTPVANGNIIKSNVISGYINPLFDGGGTTNTVVSGNAIK